jgi:hypothetical protein
MKTVSTEYWPYRRVVSKYYCTRNKFAVIVKVTTKNTGAHMKKRKRLHAGLRLLLLGMLITAVSTWLYAQSADTFLIDDFSRQDRRSALGTGWQKFTDQVMGGVSEGNYGFFEIDGRRCIRLQGRVSLENRGGFIQVSLPLYEKSGSFDASDYRGVRLLVRGNGERYYVHFKSTQTLFPWQLFSAGFPTTGAWETIDLLFERFVPENLNVESLNVRRLKRIAIVAGKKEYTADVAVARIEFYR